MKLNSLAGIIQFLLKGLPTRDDPVPNSRLFALVCRYLGQRGEQFTGLIITPEMGAVVVFPAYYTHPHQALPVQSGVKYVMTTWLFHSHLMP